MMHRTYVALMSSAVFFTALTPSAEAQSNEELLAEIKALTDRLKKLEAKVEKADAAPMVHVNPARDKGKPSSVAEIAKREPAPSIKTADGAFTFNPRGRVFVDWGTGSDDNGSFDFDGTELRAAWFGIDGSAWKNVKYKFEADFGGNTVSVKDAYISVKYGGLSYTIGQSKVPNSLEWLTAVSQTTFMERAAFKDAFGLGRRMGIKITKNADNWGFSTGVFRGTNSSSADKEGWLVAARAHYGQKADNTSWMLGASLRLRDEQDSTLRYRARPVNHLAPRLVDVTGTDKDTFFSGEAALVMGPFFTAAEYAVTSADDAAIDGSNASFKGGYLELGWNITGEARPLDLKKGTFGRAKVSNPLFEGGSGLWQLAARYDMVDLTNDGLYGGKQESWVFGISWYPNRYSRVMLNYGHSNVSELLTADNSADTLGLRFNLDW